MFFHFIGRITKMALANINSYDPSDNSTIPLRKDILQINYDVTVSLSNRNITIYQINETSTMMRQTTPGLASEFCTIDPDHKVISLKVLPSTFNQPNQIYAVNIESNFVKQNDTNEPMIGNEQVNLNNLYTGEPLVDFNWKLHTGNCLLFIIFFLFKTIC